MEKKKIEGQLIKIERLKRHAPEDRDTMDQLEKKIYELDSEISSLKRKIRQKYWMFESSLCQRTSFWYFFIKNSKYAKRYHRFLDLYTLLRYYYIEKGKKFHRLGNRPSINAFFIRLRSFKYICLFFELITESWSWRYRSFELNSTHKIALTSSFLKAFSNSNLFVLFSFLIKLLTTSSLIF